MDTFMDKLTQKLTAQEMIKANAAADAAELTRLREQTAAYESLFQKMMKANEKNTAEIENLISLATAKIEEVKADNKETEDLKQILDELKKVQNEQYEQLTDHVHKENVKVYRNVQAVVVEETARQNELSGKTLSSVKGRLGGILGISIAALLVAVAGLVFQLLQYLNVI